MTENKKIIIGDTFTKYEDGSFDVKCVTCGKETHLEADGKQAIRYCQIEGAAAEHTCPDCWRKAKDEAFQDRIVMGQARNLAQNDVHQEGLSAKDGTKYWDLLDEYQIEHFKKLKGRQNNQNNESKSINEVS